MAAEVLERNRITTQRQMRRLRQQRLLRSAVNMANGDGALFINGTHPKKLLLVKDLGWSKEQAADNHARLRNFARFWEGPGMKEYDLIDGRN